MPLREVYTIDVDDSAFTEFQRTFEKYQDALAKLPNAWGKVNEKIGEAGSEFAALAASMMTFLELSGRSGREMESIERHAGGAGRFMSSMAREAREISHFLGDATRSILRWTGITTAAAGLMGFGSVWGLDEVGAWAGNLRRTSSGMGFAPGNAASMQAFQTNLSRLVDPGTFLGGVNAAMHDPSQRWTLGGINIAGRDTGQVGLELLQNIWRTIHGTNPRDLSMVMQAHGFNNYLSLQDAVRLQQTPYNELDTLIHNTRRDLSGNRISDADLKHWQDFDTALQRAGNTLWNTIVKDLEPLSEPLTKLSAGFIQVVDAFLKSPVLGKAIGDVTSGLSDLAKYISSPQFKKDFDTFTGKVLPELLTDFEILSKGLGSLAKFMLDHPFFFGLGEGSLAGTEDEYKKYLTPNTGTPEPGIMGWIHRNFNFGGVFGPHAGWNSSEGAAPSYRKAIAGDVVGTARAAGASDAAIQAMLAATLGEGGLAETWKPGDHGSSHGPWQLHAGGELDRYLREGNQAGNVAQQTNYVLKRLNEIMPGFSQLTDPAAGIPAITKFESSVQGPGYYAANLGSAGKILADLNKPTAPASGGHPFDVITGDSIAKGLQTVSGITGAWARVGAPPSEVLEHLRTNANMLHDRSVLLSSGISNNISDLGSVAQELKVLHDVGAHTTLLGVGTRADYVKYGVNSALEKLAAEYGAEFAGPLTDLQKDHVHPHFKPYWTHLMSAIGNSAAYASPSVHASGEAAAAGTSPSRSSGFINRFVSKHGAPQVKIDVRNNTGGNTTVSAAQVASP